MGGKFNSLRCCVNKKPTITLVSSQTQFLFCSILNLFMLAFLRFDQLRQPEKCQVKNEFYKIHKVLPQKYIPLVCPGSWPIRPICTYNYSDLDIKLWFQLHKTAESNFLATQGISRDSMRLWVFLCTWAQLPWGYDRFQEVF